MPILGNFPKGEARTVGYSGVDGLDISLFAEIPCIFPVNGRERFAADYVHRHFGIKPGTPIPADFPPLAATSVLNSLPLVPLM